MRKNILSARDLCLTSVFVSLIAVLAQISVPIPFSPIPISLGMVGVYTAAILLSPKCAILSQICYLLLGAVGIPVFGGFRGGMGALLGPTGGYLLVYPIMAAIISLTLNGKQALSAERNQRHILIKGAISICTAHLVLYLGGTIWLSATTGNSFVASLSLAVIPYIPLDIIKIAFCVFAIIPLRKHFMKMGMLTMQKPFG